MGYTAHSYLFVHYSRQHKNIRTMVMEQLLAYNYTWSDLVGNIGVVLLIYTFYANVHGTLNAQGFWYNFNNLTVAILLGINLYYKPNISSIIIEIFWLAISVYGLIKWYKNEKVNNTDDKSGITTSNP